VVQQDVATGRDRVAAIEVRGTRVENR